MFAYSPKFHNYLNSEAKHCLFVACKQWHLELRNLANFLSSYSFPNDVARFCITRNRLFVLKTRAGMRCGTVD